MEEASQQNGVLVNGTRAAEALSQLLNNSRLTVIEVEALVTVAAALMFLELILATWKRRWPNSIVSFALSLCSASLPALVFYTLSIMQSSPAKNSMYPVWGASLLMAAGGRNAVSLFDYDDKKKKVLVEFATVIARYGFNIYMLTLLLIPYSSKESWITVPFEARKNLRQIESIEFLLVIFLIKAMEIAISMLLIDQINVNDHQNDTHDESIEGDEYPDLGETLEDVCLSLALCHDSLQRYLLFNSLHVRLPFSIAQARLAFNGLLETEEHCQRAFRIIEVELGFWYDFLFTKYHIIYYVPSLVLNFLLFLLRVFFLTLALVYTVQGSVTISTHHPIVQVQITRADNIITLVLLGTALVVELLEALLYMASDWIMVSLARLGPNAFLEKLIGFFSRVTILSPRRNKMAQYTVIFPAKSFFMFFLKCNLDPVEISPDIEKAIARSIRATFGEQINRLASQVRNSMFEHWALKDHWTLKDHSQVEIMLIWHIATDYCHHLSPRSGDGNNPDRSVAVTLSRYCAYLLAFVPQLLPYHAPDIRKLINKVKKERDDNLQSSEPSERYQEMEELGNDHPPTTVFRKGVKLGKQLEDMTDEEQRWKAMADFWAKTIIYVAPSHITVKEHMRKLEDGGEFLTHIWAMLSHVGILNLVRDDNEVAMPAQPTEETV